MKRGFAGATGFASFVDGAAGAENNPAHCEIVPGADTTIEITKDKDEDGKPMGLGLSIVGGSDTLLGAIFIHEVYEKGAAESRTRTEAQIAELKADHDAKMSELQPAPLELVDC